MLPGRARRALGRHGRRLGAPRSNRTAAVDVVGVRRWSRSSSWSSRAAASPSDVLQESTAAMAVHLLTGDDESILRAAVHDLVHRLVGDGDRALMVDEFDGEDDTIARRRRRRPDAAVPHRHAGSSSPATSGGSRPTSWRRSSTTSPIRSTRPSWCSSPAAGGVPKALTDAVDAGRRRVTSTPPRRAGPRTARRGSREAAERRGVRLDAGGRRRARRPARRGRRRASTASSPRSPSTYGDGARLHGRATSSRSSARPAACRRGTSPTRSTPARPTQALDAARPHDGRRRAPPAAGDGDPAQPLRQAGPPRRARRRAPRREAAAALGIKPGFPARKALGKYRRLGGGRRSSGPSTCSPQADLDLRGRTRSRPTTS